MKVGSNIRKIRELKDMKQEYLAQKLEISLTSYGKIERGEVEVSLKRISQIAKILEIQVTVLIGFDEESFLNNLEDKTSSEPYILLISHLQEAVKNLNAENHRLLVIIEKITSPVI